MIYTGMGIDLKSRVVWGQPPPPPHPLENFPLKGSKSMQSEAIQR